LCILTSMFLDSRGEYWTKLNGRESVTQIQSPLNLPAESNFGLLLLSPNIWIVPHFQRIYLYVVILSCILVTRQQHILSFLCIYF
jgi:hypothetical protein